MTYLRTRMHSSRMCTDHRLTVSPGVGGGGGECCPGRGWYVHEEGVVWPGGGGGHTSQDRLLPPCEQTNACENITFPHTTYAVSKNLLYFLKICRCQYQLAKQLPVGDNRLISMCKGIWSRLAFVHRQQREHKT